MRFAATLIIGTALALPAMAQTTTMPSTGPAATMPTTSTARAGVPPRHHRATPRQMMREGAAQTGYRGHPTATDKGPFTADADKAYMGGGAILEGQPGGPPPPASAVSSMPQNAPLPPARR